MTSLQDLITELHNLDQQLAQFEEKYGLLSETFYAWYQSGEEPDNPEWITDFALGRHVSAQTAPSGKVSSVGGREPGMAQRAYFELV